MLVDRKKDACCSPPSTNISNAADVSASTSSLNPQTASAPVRVAELVQPTTVHADRAAGSEVNYASPAGAIEPIRKVFE